MTTDSGSKKPSFKPANIFNWTELEAVQIHACDYKGLPGIGADVLVTIEQSGGGMHFQHSMTPEQARGMAAALIAAADFLEGAA